MKHSILSAVAACALATTAMADTPQPMQQNNSNAVWFENWTGLSNAIWTIAQPDGQIITIRAKTGTPVFQLAGGNVIDGIYRYELTAATEEEVEIKSQFDSGREAARTTSFKPLQLSGRFHVQRGAIMIPEIMRENDEG
ncbi:hypothetical protein LZG00_19940 [Rhodobacteraceae bacterium LMO-12]|nr:hypothetical protein [Rhodobacteraceae bacterium LMO-JJ12]